MGTVEQLKAKAPKSIGKLSDAMSTYLTRGLQQPGGKLPLFDAEGQKVSDRTVRSAIDKGLAEPWFINPLKPDFLVCRLTALGYEAVGAPIPLSRK